METVAFIVLVTCAALGLLTLVVGYTRDQQRKHEEVITMSDDEE
jgi:hypothetical protein